MLSAARIAPFGDGTLLLELDQRVDELTVARAAAIADAWESAGHGFAVPAYASVVLRYDPERLGTAAAEEHARRAERRIEAEFRSRVGEHDAGADRRVRDQVHVPTSYDGEDLADVARRSRMSVDELIDAHSSREYTAFFLGFMPGFAYLGSLDPRISAPRLPSPRARVPAGAVAVADGQTAIYPFASPGGWRLIGHTAMPLFDAAADPPASLRAGDRVRFDPV